MTQQILLRNARWTDEDSVVEVIHGDVITKASRQWRRFENERLYTLINWLEKIDAGPVTQLPVRLEPRSRAAVATVAPPQADNSKHSFVYSPDGEVVCTECLIAQGSPEEWEPCEGWNAAPSTHLPAKDDVETERCPSCHMPYVGHCECWVMPPPPQPLASSVQETLPLSASDIDQVFPCGALMGAAGTGKSTILRNRIAEDPKYAILAATTGIAAVNLGEGVTTIHSLLGFYDTASALQAHRRGYISRRFEKLAKQGYKNVVIDEMSMLPSELLQILHDAAYNAAVRVWAGEVWANDWDEDSGAPRSRRVDVPCGILLTGDFCQLPPVSGQFAFKAQCWNEFYSKRIEPLTKVWRQDNPQFLKALTATRNGDGARAAIELKKAGVKFASEVDHDFDGVTLYATRASVDKFNRERLAKLPGDSVILPSAKLGKPASEWDSIQDELELKTGTLVMILANNRDLGVVNGDLAYVLSTPQEVAGDGFVRLKLRRNGNEVPIGYITRTNLSYREDDSMQPAFEATNRDLARRCKNWESDDKATYAEYKQYLASVEFQGEPFKPYYEPMKEGTVIGEVEYMPLRVAYASTIHKVQGLTLESVQIDCNNKWAGNPGMVYVALTRCKTPEGIRVVVSDVNRFARRVNTSKLVKEWI